MAVLLNMPRLDEIDAHEGAPRISQQAALYAGIADSAHEPPQHPETEETT
ncbi:hypothetical protein [Nonomuraea jabiensis]